MSLFDPCIICGQVQDDALIFTATGNYGSSVFDPTDTPGSDTEQLKVIICDSCIIARIDLVKHVTISTPHPTVKTDDWRPALSTGRLSGISSDITHTNGLIRRDEIPADANIKPSWPSISQYTAASQAETVWPPHMRADGLWKCSRPDCANALVAPCDWLEHTWNHYDRRGHALP